MKDHKVYADHAATAKVSERALAAALPFLGERFGNPSAVYGTGTDAAGAMLTARKRIAGLLGADASELFFTSGGTEADNWAVKSAAELCFAAGKRHIVTTNIEHHAVLGSCRHLERLGFEVTYLPADRDGLISPEQVSSAVREDTALVSVMLANNEIGTLQPVAQIGEICRERGVLLHTDAVQAAGHIPIDVKELGADMLSLSGHKFGSPKGIGALYVRKGLTLPPLLDGGAQERGRRAGTENTAGAAAMSEALAESLEDLEAKTARLLAMRERLIGGLLRIPGSRLNGDRQKRLPGNVNISFEGIEGEGLIVMLDMLGVQASSGSACTSFSPEPSHVLKAIGLSDELAKGSLRLTLGADNTSEDADRILEAVPKAVERLRRMSPCKF